MLEDKQALIRQLQTQLRNEEMSLVLLKKIRQSQVLADQAKEAAAKVSIQPAGGTSALVPQVTGAPGSAVASARQSHRGTPPPNSVKASSQSSGFKSTGGVSSAAAAAAVAAAAASVNNARPGGNMKNVLTPDLSLLKPVSVVRQLLCF